MVMDVRTLHNPNAAYDHHPRTRNRTTFTNKEYQRSFSQGQMKTYFTLHSLFLLICLAASLLLLPLILPPLPPPPPLMLLILPIGLVVVLMFLAFMPCNVRDVTNNYTYM